MFIGVSVYDIPETLSWLIRVRLRTKFYGQRWSKGFEYAAAKESA